MALFETLKHMAENNMDIKRFDTLHSADMTSKMGKITMCTSPECIRQLGGIGKQTHIPILFMINAEEYDAVEKLLAGKG